MSRLRVSLVLLAAALGSRSPVAAQSNDPPGRVGRVSAVTGSVSLKLSGDTEWRPASLNYPLTTGDALWADAGARTEIHLGASAVHLAEATSLGLDAVEDELIQLRVGQGTVHVRLRALVKDDDYEIDTPAGTVILRAEGDYRIDVTPDGQRTTVTVRAGDADVLVGNTRYPVRPGTSTTVSGSAYRPLATERALAPDEWEQWADARNRREDAAKATRYVPREMVGYEDLDPYGDWQIDASWGPIWYPRSVASGWAPYAFGRWEYVQPWGWTWIDEAPWGFAPFHYGRWAHDRGRWGWIPGTVRARPVYAPALVAFVSGPNWDVSLSFGGNGGVGWIPLGPDEVYVPGYRASQTYTRNINITSVNITRIDITRVDVNAVQYRNRNVAGAVTVVRRDDFEQSRPVGRNAVRVRPGDLASGRVTAAPIAANAPIPRPARNSPAARERADNAGPVRRPPVDLPSTPRPSVAGRGRERNDVPAPVTPPAALPAKPLRPTQDRDRADERPPVTPNPVVPAEDRARADERPPVIRQPVVEAPATRTATPKPLARERAVPAAPPVRGNARGTPATPATPPAAQPAAPTRPATPPVVRGRPTSPAPVPRAPKPVRARPDTVRH